MYNKSYSMKKYAVEYFKNIREREIRVSSVTWNFRWNCLVTARLYCHAHLNSIEKVFLCDWKVKVQVTYVTAQAVERKLMVWYGPVRTKLVWFQTIFI